MGVLCVLDERPRRLSATQREVLHHLATAVSRALKGRRALLSERALREQAWHAQALLQSSLDAIVALRLDGTVMHWNEAATRLFGHAAADMLGQPIARIVPADRAGEQADLAALLREHPAGQQYETQRLHRDGQPIAVSVSLAPLRDPQGVLVGATKIIRDIRAQARAAQELQDERRRLAWIIEATAAGTWEWNVQTGQTRFNERWAGILGRTLDELAPISIQTWLDHAHPEDLQRSAALLQRHFDGETETYDCEARMRHRDGHWVWVLVRGRVMTRTADGLPQWMFGTHVDITSLHRLNEELRHRAAHDALTGLPNRTEFETRLQRLLHRCAGDGTRHALMYLDLDQFKLVNDACGHAAGDRLLQQVARLLSGSMRSRDTLARLGGDEFGLLLEHCDEAHAQRVAQQICQRMDDFRFSCEEQRFRIGASIGLVPVDARWGSLAAVMQAADTSCYAAKEAGRNRVHRWHDSDAALRARQGEMQLATRLEQALDEDRFVLYAQRIEPLGEAGPGGALHAELLLRLLERDGTVVAPGGFLPAAERFQLAPRIDRWVLTRTLALLRALPDLSVVDMLCVNLSGQSVGDRAFQGDALAALEAAGPLLCRRLCLEITETAAVTNIAEASAFIAQARALGLRIALDDFGAGASSFGYLKSLQIDLLKIDGQFVRNLVDDPLDDAAVRCFQQVARVVGVQTVAEFVDSPAVLQRLQEIGVDHAQGYLLHKPQPVAQVLQGGTSAPAL
ncbi:putative bifunctional diguanylate cyclase/phosphodiesterase [Azohydromonas lata]|uniref:EAL domain-containing protein n=1 Tax=Azohydromonas lata TaxID=45677 RepID=A0ABU5IRD9_9BURK|nr:EAL domain-containing protein [Azohydromonas lata]MDZ5461462.1 EAL domain-containing protein [Azohydromonas lata]